MRMATGAINGTIVSLKGCRAHGCSSERLWREDTAWSISKKSALASSSQPKGSAAKACFGKTPELHWSSKRATLSDLCKVGRAASRAARLDFILVGSRRSQRFVYCAFKIQKTGEGHAVTEG